MFQWRGLYYADGVEAESLKRLYADWKALDYSTQEMFGCALAELPPKLRHDLIILKKMDMWHQWNVRQPKKSVGWQQNNPLRRIKEMVTGQKND